MFKWCKWFLRGVNDIQEVRMMQINQLFCTALIKKKELH